MYRSLLVIIESYTYGFTARITMPNHNPLRSTYMLSAKQGQNVYQCLNSLARSGIEPGKCRCAGRHSNSLTTRPTERQTGVAAYCVGYLYIMSFKLFHQCPMSMQRSLYRLLLHYLAFQDLLYGLIPSTCDDRDCLVIIFRSFDTHGGVELA